MKPEIEKKVCYCNEPPAKRKKIIALAQDLNKLSPREHRRLISTMTQKIKSLPSDEQTKLLGAMKRYTESSR